MNSLVITTLTVMKNILQVNLFDKDKCKKTGQSEVSCNLSFRDLQSCNKKTKKMCVH